MLSLQNYKMGEGDFVIFDNRNKDLNMWSLED